MKRNIRNNSIVALIMTILFSMTASTSEAQLLKKGLNALKKEVVGKRKQSKTEKEVNKIVNNVTGAGNTVNNRRTTNRQYNAAPRIRETAFEPQLDTIIGKLQYKLNPGEVTTGAWVSQAADVHRYELTEVTVIESIRYKGRTYYVKNIGDNAFRSETHLTKVNLPSHLVEIGPNAFSGTVRLQHIEIPKSVKTIKRNAFSCSGIKTITLHEGLRTIEGNTFTASSITKITIPNSVTDLQTYAFCDCESLVEVKLPENIKKINSNTFQQCTNLKSIVIPEGVNMIDEGAFWGCSSLQSVKLPQSLRKVKGLAFADCKSLTTLSFPAGVEEIADMDTFSGCQNLNHVTLPQKFIDNPETLYIIFLDCPKMFNPKNIKDLSHFTGI